MMTRVTAPDKNHLQSTPELFTSDDRRWMNIAIALAELAKGTTFPNPAVGAVVVKQGKVIGKGCTACCGGPHAEKTALANAGSKAKNATLYVTLEPCCHHGRTPPCTDAIIAAGITRVVLAIRDPNPLVAGKGVAHLLKHGIQVQEGLQHDKANAINEDFFWSIQHKKPWITLKLALTLDGCAADSTGESQWITSTAARTFVHELRRRHAMVAVGRGTLVKDNPRLTVRHVKAGSPARVVFLSTLKDLADDSQLIKDAGTIRTIIVLSGGAKCSRTRRADNIEIWQTGRKSRLASFLKFLELSHNFGLTSILVEGGPTLGSFLLQNKLVNRIHIMHGNAILGGGLNGISFEKGLGMRHKIVLDKIEHRRFGDTISTTGIPVWSC